MTTPVNPEDVNPEDAYPEPTVKTPNEPVNDGLNTETIEKLAMQFWKYYVEATGGTGIDATLITWEELDPDNRNAVRDAVMNLYGFIIRGEL